MSTLQNAARYWRFLAAVWFILVALANLGIWSAPGVVVGGLALVIGILLFFAS